MRPLFLGYTPIKFSPTVFIEDLPCTRNSARCFEFQPQAIGDLCQYRVLSGGGDMSSINRHSRYSGMCSYNQGMYRQQRKCRGNKFSREIKEDFMAEYVYLYLYVRERIDRTWWPLFLTKENDRKGKVGGPGFLEPIANLIELKT